MSNPDHLHILRRQILTLAGGPTARDEIFSSLPLVGDKESLAEAREQTDLLVEMGYLQATQWEGRAYVQRTAKAATQLNKATLQLDPLIWGMKIAAAGGQH